MNIEIIGYGFVGKAHALALEGSGVQTHVYDPAKGLHSRIEKPDGIIICVSTPEDVDGSCDIRNVYDTIKNSPNVPILIKSTISIEGWRKINKDFPDHDICFSPEYLRQDHAYEDFKSQTSIQVGGHLTSFWEILLSKSFGVEVQMAAPEELIMAKYLRNSFLALKVAFFNQAHDLCKSLDINHNNVIMEVCKDKRIGISHSKITAERGFGGHCFPKDTSAIVKTAKKYGCNLSILEEAIKYNDRIRNK